MKRLAFKMKLHNNCEAEYKKRHDEIGEELTTLLHAKGMTHYSIFLDAGTNALFAVMSITDELALNDLPQHPVMQRWWAFMSDIMETNSDHSPVSVPMQEVFYME